MEAQNGSAARSRPNSKPVSAASARFGHQSSEMLFKMPTIAQAARPIEGRAARPGTSGARNASLSQLIRFTVTGVTAAAGAIEWDKPQAKVLFSCSDFTNRTAISVVRIWVWTALPPVAAQGLSLSATASTRLKNHSISQVFIDRRNRARRQLQGVGHGNHGFVFSSTHISPRQKAGRCAYYILDQTKKAIETEEVKARVTEGEPPADTSALARLLEHLPTSRTLRVALLTGAGRITSPRLSLCAIVMIPSH